MSLIGQCLEHLILADPALSKDWTRGFFHPKLLYDSMYLELFFFFLFQG